MIRFVSHCYAKNNYQYASFLKIQLESIKAAANHTPGIDIVVCFCLEDAQTVNVINEYIDQMGNVLIPLAMRDAELFRRSIGRNRATKLPTHSGDLPKFYWFTDVDYFFSPDIAIQVDKAYSSINREAILFYPKFGYIQRSHSEGDDLAKNVTGIPDVSTWKKKRHSRAIGGIQIVNGHWARQNGYVPTGKWSKPRTDGKPFGDFQDDLAFRKIVEIPGTGLDIPGVYRCRHTCKTY
tara:strand:+ start:3201 stop:3911 length:711 start_codon:yes stop_codon:yes gene_type:complete